MDWELIERYISQLDLHGSDILVYDLLKKKAIKDKVVISYQEIAKKINLSKMGAVQIINRLVKNGIIERRTRYDKFNVPFNEYLILQDFIYL